jgi:hypothetical protein
LPLSLPQLPCQHGHLPLLVGERVLRLLSHGLESLDLQPLLLDLLAVRGSLLVNVPLDVPELLLVLPDLQVEGLDLRVSVDDILLLTADALLVALPQVPHLGEEVVLQLFELNPFVGQLVEGLHLGALLSEQLVLEGPELVPELLQARLGLAFDFALLGLSFLDLLAVDIVQLVHVGQVVASREATATS